MNDLQPPVHVLMGELSHRRHIDWSTDLPNDYIIKRQKVIASTTAIAPNTNSLWSGVTKIELDLLDCCEDSEDVDIAELGALDPKKEIQFLGILARSCHTLASRSLAIAILERTLETYIFEEEEKQREEEEEEETAEPDDKNDPDFNPGNKKKAAKDQTELAKKDGSSEGDNDDDDGDDEEEEEEEEQVQRLEVFLGGGGLKILNHWLQDVIDPPTAVADNTKSQLRSKVKPPPVPTNEPSPMRALVLPLLAVLENLPVEKGIVMSSKINKQIKKLSKLVANKNDPPSFFASASAPDTTNALEQIQLATESVMKTWQVEVKKRPDSVPDPFASLKEKMGERLELLVNFEQDQGPKPKWLEKLQSKEKKVDTQKNAAKARNSSKLAILAANERQREREHLKRRLKAAEEERRQNVVKLREQMQKRKIETQSAPDLAVPDKKLKPNAKTIKWKDGLTTQHNRNRTLLEEVFVFTKDVAETAAEVPEVVARVVRRQPSVSRPGEADYASDDSDLYY